MKIKVIEFLFFFVLSLILTACSKGFVSESLKAASPTITVSNPTPTKQRSLSPVNPSAPPTLTSISDMAAPTGSPTDVAAASHPEGTLYIWIYNGLQPLYTRVDLSKNDLRPLLEGRISPEPMVENGRTTIALAFAPYSPQIAYLDQNTESVDLWLSDLDLSQIEHVWKNDQQWLGPLFSSGDAYLQWGPAENSIILSSSFLQDNIVVVSLKSKEIVEGVGKCDRIAPLPNSDRLTVWCSFETGAPLPYGALTDNGDILYSKSLPENSIEVFDWSFSPTDDRLIFAPNKGNVAIADDRGGTTELPIRLLNKPSKFRSQPYLQWSQDGKRLLVYAFNQDYCPLWEDPGLGNLIEKECWLVLDAETGDFLWWPEASSGGIDEATGVPLTNLASDCAGLSPDGNWIAICYFSGAIKDFLLVSIQDKEVIDLHSLQTMNFKWMESLK